MTKTPVKTKPVVSKMEIGEWEKTVRGWYRAYSEHEKLLVLETESRMINYIQSLLTLQAQQQREEMMFLIVEDEPEKIHNEFMMNGKMTKGSHRNVLAIIRNQFRSELREKLLVKKEDEI